VRRQIDRARQIRVMMSNRCRCFDQHKNLSAINQYLFRRALNGWCFDKRSLFLNDSEERA